MPHNSELKPEAVIASNGNELHEDQSNVPDGMYRTVNGKLLFGNGNKCAEGQENICPRDELGRFIDGHSGNPESEAINPLSYGATCERDSQGRFLPDNQIATGRPPGSVNITTPWFNGEITDSDISRLETMSKSQLITLLKTLGGVVGYALMDEEEKLKAAELKLYGLAMKSNEVHKVIPAIKEWYDRTKGKAPQSISLDVKDTRMDKLPIDKLLRLAGMLDEPVVVLPPPE